MDLNTLFQDGRGRIYFQDCDEVEVVATSVEELLDIVIIGLPGSDDDSFQHQILQATDLIDVQRILADYDMYYAAE